MKPELRVDPEAQTRNYQEYEYVRRVSHIHVDSAHRNLEPLFCILMLIKYTQPPLISGYFMYSTSILDAADEYTDVDPRRDLDGNIYRYAGTLFGTVDRAMLGKPPRYRSMHSHHVGFPPLC